MSLSLAISVTLVLYVLAMALGTVRVLFGPRAQDRVLALDFLYIVGMPRRSWRWRCWPAAASC